MRTFLMIAGPVWVGWAWFFTISLMACAVRRAPTPELQPALPRPQPDTDKEAASTLLGSL